MKPELVNPVSFELEIKELRKLLQFIKEYFGYDFSNYAMSSFKRRVQRIMQIKNYHNIDLLLENMRSSDDFYNNFLTEITVNVTEMFRDPTFWKEIRDKIIPDLLRHNDQINIWHAGCSSGEEVISMGILLHEMDILDRVSIMATDLDSSIINKAQKGEFNVKNIDQNQKNYLEFQGKSGLMQYGQQENGKVLMDGYLLENVNFKVHDLVRDPIEQQFHLILCRNVMIYFNQTLQNAVLEKLFGGLYDSGYLAIGAKESIGWCQISSRFKLVNNAEKIYQRVKA